MQRRYVMTAIGGARHSMLRTAIQRTTASSLRPRVSFKAPLISLHRTFASSIPRNMKVVAVPVRDDNYAYLLIDEPSKKAAAVDPYDVTRVSAAAEGMGVEIVAGITTHHHYDHAGGNKVSKRGGY